MKARLRKGAATPMRSPITCSAYTVLLSMSRIGEVTDAGAAVGVPPGRSRVSSRCLRGATPDPAFGLIWADGHLVRGDSIGKHADGYGVPIHRLVHAPLMFNS